MLGFILSRETWNSLSAINRPLFFPLNHRQCHIELVSITFESILYGEIGLSTQNLLQGPCISEIRSRSIPLVCCQRHIKLGGTTIKSILHSTMVVSTRNLLWLKPSISETPFYLFSKCCQCCVKLSSMKFEGILYKKLNSAHKIFVRNPQSMQFIGGRKRGTPHLTLEP